MELITGVSATDHIDSQDDADFQKAITGPDNYVLNIGRKMEAELLSNNVVRVHDGSLIHQGRHVIIPEGESEEVIIEYGTQGEKRIDLIVSVYSKDTTSGIETEFLKSIKGTPSVDSPAIPSHIDGNIRAGDIYSEFPLYKVTLDGINIVSIDPLYEVLTSMAELKTMTDELNRKLPACNEIYTGVANHAQYDIPDITPYDLLVIYGGPGTYANTSMVVPVASIVYKDDGQFALGVYQGSSTFWELEFNFPTSTKINIANYKNQSWTTPAIRKILGIKL